jgi:serine/threonine-protein kinase
MFFGILNLHSTQQLKGTEDMTELIGKTLDHYLVTEKLGEGGMAIVYKARDIRLNREVALKVIHPDVFGPAILERILERFKREALTLAKLTHPNIVSILDYGEYQGAPYLVMQYLPGGTLKQKLTKPIPYLAAVRLLIPVAKALAHAHGQGIIHRDVKPANILIGNAGEPMLSDFGIAKLLDNNETRELTGTGVGIGTPEYMAPEQGEGRADERADIYALGTILYEMIAGRKPYQADTPLAIMLKKSIEPLPRPTKFIPSLPEVVERVLFKALAKNPEDRYVNMSEFANALERLAKGELPKNVSLPIRLGLGLVAGLIVCGMGIAGVWISVNVLNQPDGKNKIPTTESLVVASPVVIPSTSTPSIDLSTSTAATFPYASPTPIDTITLSNDGAELVYVPQGEFIMGSDPGELYFWGAETPKHSVLLDAFWIYRTEVTNTMYRACVEVNACPHPTEIFSRTHDDYFPNEKFDDYPVIYVTHEAALSYCVWAGARLPTEAEWEKAARGTDGRLFPWGNDELQNYHANFCDNGCPNPESQEEMELDDGYRDVAPVGSFPAGSSPYGAWDMSGNVLEWAADWYSQSYYGISPYENPTGPESGSKHVIRGGSWWSGRDGLRPAARASKDPDYSSDMVGFRCAIDAP